ncbi:MAG: DUF4382 domain-containing protein, partial [Candidatus Latescibacterota bacterium]
MRFVSSALFAGRENSVRIVRFRPESGSGGENQEADAMTRTKSIAALLGRVVLFSIIAGLVGGCVSSTGPESAGGAPEAAPAKGYAPARDFEAIPIIFSGIKVLRGETNGAGEWIDLPVGHLSTADRSFDLLAVQGGLEAILGSATLEPGVYLGMRIVVESAAIVVDGVLFPLMIPGGALRILEAFEVGPSGVPSLPLDFSLQKSVMEVGKGRPRFRMHPILELDEPPPPPQTGTISGTVVPSVYALVSAYVAGTADLAASVYTDPTTDGFLLADLSPGTYDL